MTARRYAWEPGEGFGRYRDLRTGRIVPESEIRRVIDRALREDQKRAAAITDLYRAKQITREEWNAGMRQIVKDVHLYTNAAARGGWSNMTPSAYGQTGAAVRAQYRFLEQFNKELQRGKQKKDGTMTRRAKMYVQAGRTTFHKAERTVKSEAGATHERNVLAAETDTCNPQASESCTAQSGRGWVPLGELLPIGRRLCHTNCRCRIEYKAVEE